MPARGGPILKIALALVLAAADARGQPESDGPPDRLPAGARLGTTPVTLATQPLSLPPGFGVGTTQATGTAGGSTVETAPSAPVAEVGSSAIASTPPETTPPDRVPTGASFASAAVSFTSADLSFASAPISGGAGQALALGGATTDLPGVSVQEEGGGYRFTLGADVLFDFDKHDLRPEAGPVLRKLVEQVEAQVPSARWQVEGHTDSKGSDAYNDRLSNRRAASVRRWLATTGGVPNADIATIGFGERRPVAPNEHPDGSDDPEGRQKNRRVEILVTPRP